MSIKIALAGNPNSGKTTLFNILTGSTQYVGNWPGVTVERKEGRFRFDKNVLIQDLPGIYSLSPYTLEEVVTRNYLVNDKPDAIINIIDGTNIERNLYLTTQLIELGIPTVIAVNMIDLVRKKGDYINFKKLGDILGCEVIETSAMKGEGAREVVEAAVRRAEELAYMPPPPVFHGAVEHAIAHIEESIENLVEKRSLRWYAVKLFERDEKIIEELNLSKDLLEHIEEHIADCERMLDDDAESIIINQRYAYISKVIDIAVKRKHTDNKMSASDTIDSIVTNRWLGLPVFAAVMFGVYYVSVTTVGTWVTDFTNDMFVGEWLQVPLKAWLASKGTAEWLTGLVTEGIVGGVGAVMGFLPQMLILFFFLAILEDCGYMARVAFLMDRIFRKMGMSGKSFIPMLIGTGCGVPGIMAARTIEQQKDRRMTIITVTFMPCGAKLPLIALIAGALFGNAAWVAASAYFAGIGAVVVTGIMLKKTKAFAGEPAPFVMELPAYHFPTVKNIWFSMYERGSSFVRKAFTVYMLASILVWFGGSFGWVDGAFGMVENLNDSVLHSLGDAIAWLFAPCGFDKWQAVIASILGLAAKEEVVGVLGVLSAIGDPDMALELVETGGNLSPIAALFPNALAGYAFLIFNLLCAPCFAAMNTIRTEMNNWKWTLFAIGYQCIFAYAMAMLIYQLGTLFAGGPFTFESGAAIAILAFMLFMLFRPGYKENSGKI